MSHATSSPAFAKHRRWPRLLGGLLGLLILILVAAYFVVTSSGFLKGFILPRVSQAVHASITVEDAAISPFSQVVLKNLKVQTTGTEPLFTAVELRVRYHLMDILGGHINVDEITLASPTVNVVQNADDTSNLDPLLKATAAETKPTPAAKPTPLQIDLKKLTLANGTVRQIKNHAGGGRDITELANINVTLTNLKNGGSAGLLLGANISLDQQPPAPAAAGSLAAKIAGQFAIALTADLQPASANGNTRFDITKAGGAFKDLNALAATIGCDITPTEIKQLALQFQKGDIELGSVRVNGPFELQKTEGRLNVEIIHLDRQVLNLAGATAGLDFGGTVINSTNMIELTKAGMGIAATGRFTAKHLQVTHAAQTTPILDLHADYRAAIDRTTQTVRLETLTVTGTQDQKPLLRAELDQPMTLALGNAANAIGDSTLKVEVNNLNLADWKPFLGDTVSKGSVGLQTKLTSQSGGKQLAFELDSQIAGLEVRVGSNVVSQADLALQAHGQATDLKQFKLESYRATAVRGGETLIAANGSGSYDTASATADLQVKLQAALPGLAKLSPALGANLSSGSLELAAHVTQKAQVQTVTGTLNLADLTGTLGGNKFRDYKVAADLDLTKAGSQFEIRRAAGTLAESANAGGTFNLSGNFDTEKNSGAFNAKLADCNQNGLRPFLEPLLAGKRLTSVALNATINAKLDPAGDSTAQAEAQVTRLVVNDPAGKFPATPLEARLQLDASFHKQIADLRQFTVTLTPTTRAKNEISLSGKVDATVTNAITGSLKLAAEALDLTSYYDLFAGQPTTASASTTPLAAPSTAEPEAIQLPFKNFTVDATISRLYLRELDIADLHAALKLDGGHVQLQPLQFMLNQAPVRADADINLGVPGYQYDVNFSAKNVPVAPLANSFSPDYKNQASGELLASANIKGAGLTGASLQKSLNGNASLALTNANIQLVGPKAKMIITPIALVLGLDELTHTPLNGLNAQLQMGSGQITLTQCNLRGETFRAEVTGEMPIAPVLNDSRFNNWPINIALRRELAAKARLLSADTPTNAVFVQLPTFAKLGGTLGKPEAKTDKLVIAGLIARSVGGVPGVVGGDAGKLLQGIGGLLGGKTTAAESETVTNAPADGAAQPAQPEQPINLFDLFRKK